MSFFSLRPSMRYAVGVGLICFSTGQVASSTRLLQTRDISAGTVLESPIDPTHDQTFRLHLNAGESVQMEVLQIGADVVIDVSRPDGRLLDSFDGPTGRNGTENVEFFATLPGP